MGGPKKSKKNFRKKLTVPKTVAQCRKYLMPYLNTLCQTIPYLITLSRTLPYLSSLSRTIPYLNTLKQNIPYLSTLPSAANQIRVLHHPNRQPIRIEYYVTRELSAWVEDPSRLSARVDSV